MTETGNLAPEKPTPTIEEAFQREITALHARIYVLEGMLTQQINHTIELQTLLTLAQKTK